MQFWAALRPRFLNVESPEVLEQLPAALLWGQATLSAHGCDVMQEFPRHNEDFIRSLNHLP